MPKKIEDIKGLTIEELAAELEAALTSQKELAALSDEDLTDDKLTELETVIAFIAASRAEQTEREAAATARADRVAAARASVEEPVVEVVAEIIEEPVEVIEEPEVIEVIEEPEPVLAAAPVAAKAAKVAPTVIIPKEEPEVSKAVMVAAANVPEVTAGAIFEDFDAVARAFANRARGFGGASTGRGSKEIGSARGSKVASMKGKSVATLSDSAARFGLARIQLPESEFTTGQDQSLQEQMDTILASAKESRLPGGSLVAAGGWCAPSENIYTMSGLETVSGILSIPEVHISRGGINFTKGPDYATLAATWGFLQTEAEAEAGTEKECYEVECPPFGEVRLDAIGFCVTAGILTNVGYPELIRRVLEIGLTAHAHKVNASVIGRISALIGGAVNFTEVGGVVADVLGAAELQAERLRYTYSMAPGSTIEAIFPVWARAILRGDLSRRTGVDYLAVTDAQLDSYFRVRNIAPQYVYDYQPLASSNTSTWTTFPSSLEFMMYPAGAYVKGTTPVISLDTIYDSVGLSTNTYTAAFFEEGILVANTIGSGVKVSVAISPLDGITGAATIGAGSGS